MSLETIVGHAEEEVQRGADRDGHSLSMFFQKSKVAK